MCGRFTQNYTWAEVREFLSVFGTPRNLQPRYNIAPTTNVDVGRLDHEGRGELISMRWGLVLVRLADNMTYILVPSGSSPFRSRMEIPTAVGNETEGECLVNGEGVADLPSQSLASDRAVCI
jgi:putative SOS response-associated peptidase YedK